MKKINFKKIYGKILKAKMKIFKVGIICSLFLILGALLVFTARQPLVGGDSDEWGAILNEYLNVSLTVNGTLKQGMNVSLYDLNVTNRLNVTGNIYSGGKNISNLVRTATFVVCASDSKDTSNCDYKCDGTADNVEIQEALGALPSTGGVVYLLEGTYDIDAQITINYSNTAIIGTGKSTKLLTDDNIYMLYGLSKSGILIKDIYFYGTVNRDAIKLDTVTYSKIMNNWGEALRTLILFVGSSQSIVDGNMMKDNGISCIQLINSENNVVSNNNCYSSSGDSILLTQSSDNTIIGNVGNDSGDYGIYVSSSHGNVVTGNVFTSSTRHGIFVASSNNNVISNNFIKDSDLDDSSSWDGIHIFSSDNNIITGNRIIDSDRFEVKIDDDLSDNNIITGNIMIGTDHEGTINDSGTNTIISNNIETSGGNILMQGGYNFTNNVTFDEGTLFIDSTNDKVGIGTVTPHHALEVSGSMNVSGDLNISGSYTASSNTGLTVQLNATSCNLTITGGIITGYAGCSVS